MSLGSIGSKQHSPGSGTDNHASLTGILDNKRSTVGVSPHVDQSISDRMISTVAQVHSESQPSSSATMKCVYSNYEVHKSKAADAQTSTADMSRGSFTEVDGNREPRCSVVEQSQITALQQEQFLQQQQRQLRQQLRSVAQQRQQLRASHGSVTDTDDITSITDLESSITSGLSEITSRLDDVEQRFAGNMGDRKQSMFSTIGTQSSNIFSESEFLGVNPSCAELVWET